MRTESETKSIRDLNELFKNSILTVNPEYQRGVVWTKAQKKRLIDSIFRDYELPLIYLHHKVDNIAGIRREVFEIVDGQQRLTAISDYVEGAFKLFDPKKEKSEAKFPNFLIERDCPWGGKFFHELSGETQECFLDRKLSLVYIETEDENEVRDMFIRLQAGSALNAQEKRDAMPGGMTDFILRLGGKPQITRYPGHEFFPKLMKSRPDSDRGKTRLLAAQITMLLLHQKNAPGKQFPDIGPTVIDGFYYDNLDFDPDSPAAKEIWDLLETLCRLLGDGSRPRLLGYDALHLCLLANRLKSDFVPTWQKLLPNALDHFLLNKSVSKLSADDPRYPYWSQYVVLTRADSAGGITITRRNEFYVAKMMESMPGLKRKDNQRQFSPGERELVYLSQRKTCALCGGPVSWDDAEIHHVREHKMGGKTELANAALVHKACHPKSKADVEAFEAKWAGKAT